MTRKHCVVATAVIGATVALALATRAQQDRPARGEAYHVTPWPADSDPSGRYADEVEQYLNKMAEEGWRFHSSLEGQKAKMMIFERAPRRTP